MRATYLLLTVLLSTGLQATTIVPGGFANTAAESNGVSLLSLGSAFMGGQITGRMQQIYTSSAFTAAGSGQSIVSLAFRGDEANSILPNIATLGNIEVYLTSTATAVNGLSATYANNLNGSTRLVYSGSVTFTIPADAGNPRQFSYLINLQTPFAYSAADGNLLLDIIVKSGNNPQQSSLPALDYTRNSAAMGVLAHYSSSPTGWSDASGFLGANQGFPTQFVFAPTADIPEPATWSLIGSGLGALVILRRRKTS